MQAAPTWIAVQTGARSTHRQPRQHNGRAGCNPICAAVEELHVKPTATPPEIATAAHQLQRRREAASRCEPFDCGHRDPLDCMDVCSTPDEQAFSRSREEACSLVSTPGGEQPEFDPGDIAGLWADAKSLFFARDFPPYASKAWRELHPDDPKRLAAALEAAEMWRKYGDDVTQWLRDALAPKPPLWQGRTRAELEQARQPKPPHQLTPTPGWPPIRIPGGRGRHLTLTQEHAA